MARDYAFLDRAELESTLHRLKAELEDMEETTSFYYAHSAAHINGGEVLRDVEALEGLKSEISEVEDIIKQKGPLALPDISFGVKSDVIEHIDADGFSYLVERFERIVPVGDLEYRRENKVGCEACPRYARGNLACPPYSPQFPYYIGESSEAIVICYRVYMENVREVSGELKYRTAHKLVRGLLVEELYNWRKRGYIIAGAGPCLACKECVVETGGEACRAPSMLIYSLESLGVNLVSLSERVLGLRLQWGGGELEAEHVAAIGAAFH